MKILRVILAMLLLIIAPIALAGGGMAGATNVTLVRLGGSPFSNYFIPSLILFVLICIGFLSAAIAVFRHQLYASVLYFGCAAVLFVWIATLAERRFSEALTLQVMPTFFTANWWQQK